MKKSFFVYSIAAGLIAISACKKDEPTVEEPPAQTNDSNAPLSNATIESAYDDMTNMTDQAITGDMTYYKSPTVKFVTPEEYNAGIYDKEACAVVISLDTLNSAKSITIDWGTENCDCNDGKQRRGKLITTFTGKYRDPGTVITHTPVDYYVDDNHIEGNKTVTNSGLNSSLQPYFTITVNGKVTMTNGDVFNYTSDRVRTWTAGVGTLLNFMDDEYELTGTAEASSTTGEGYSLTITSPLRVSVGCAFVTKGTMEFTPVGKLVRVIDYGDGTCDNIFTVTVAGVTYTING